ncbi:hypothetical protein EON82_04890 [bacterium]|nr:MAG: hypothetical protein EON82_04890 [bacterium]
MGLKEARDVLGGMIDSAKAERSDLLAEIDRLTRSLAELQAGVQVKDGIIQGLEAAFGKLQESKQEVLAHELPIEDRRIPDEELAKEIRPPLFETQVEWLAPRRKKLFGLSGEVRKYYMSLGDREFTAREVTDAILSRIPDANRDSILNTLSADKVSGVLESLGKGTGRYRLLKQAARDQFSAFDTEDRTGADETASGSQREEATTE